MEENKFKFPTEMVDLPSKGLLYPESHPLAKGKIEMKYMTAREEDILTNLSYIKQGVAIDKLLQSLCVTKFDFNDLLIGDKNAIMIASRVLGYGKDYSFNYNGEEIEVDLSQLPTVEPDEKLITKGINSFEFTLPHSKNAITFRFLTHKDEQDINRELEGLKKINKDTTPELSTRLKYMITSIEGNRERKDIRDFVDNYFLAKDSRALREYIKEIQPDVDLTFFPNESSDRINIPIGVSFFWPDA